MATQPRFRSVPDLFQSTRTTLSKRRRQQTFLFRRLPILAVLILALLGCANFIHVSVPPPDETIDKIEPPAAEPLALQVAPTATPVVLPESIRGQADAEQPVTAFMALTQPPAIPAPDSAPTCALSAAQAALPSPTATLTPVPTDTPPPSPTATPIPAPTDTPLPPPTATPMPTASPAPAIIAPAAASHSPAVTTQTGISHVVIITIDGLRPDALDLANTPTLDALRAIGAYSPSAQTINPSFTLPSHVSMLNGVLPHKHGIVEALPCIGCRLEIGPTLFSVAHEAGLSTGMVFGKDKLEYLALPGTIDKLLCADAHDAEVKDKAVEFIREGLPHIFFIHLPDTDRVGHEYGWMSENQLYAVNYADSMIGEIVSALEAGGYLERTLLIITSDHGGHGFKHGDDSPVDRTVPWLAVGPGVPQGVILSSPINTVDNAATAAYALDLPIPERWDGRPVLEIFQ